MEDTFSNFLCDRCHTEIQASPDMIGQTAECPACGARLVIPAPAKEDVIRHAAGDDDPETIEAMKSRTIRIELGDI